MVYVGSWNGVVDHRNKGNLLFAADQQNQDQYGGEEKKDWLFEEVLVTFSCLFVSGRSPLGVFARYVRGLLTFPSPILHISALYSIIYCDHPQTKLQIDTVPVHVKPLK